MKDYLLQFFSYAHLPEHMQAVSKPFHDLAHEIVAKCPMNPERTVALRKLLEAKDCAVRSMIFKTEEKVEEVREKLEKFRWDITDRLGDNVKEIVRMVKRWDAGHVEALSWNPEGTTHRITIECGRSDAKVVEEILKRMKVL